ncbi:hypothetical protein EDWATA_03118 [Edwardsiella tarda ATCC 23685]|uniref:Uncharacterized protein n=1 Tax=Edwardsiella tarda ATCC 23685 TaxID=500638 RepID=D4F8L8_EDWTA|nr:hypothetical protein EDWATA_03118 [Edwardsiella tarda ATCC 23685]
MSDYHLHRHGVTKGDKLTAGERIRHTATLGGCCLRRLSAILCRSLSHIRLQV